MGPITNRQIDYQAVHGLLYQTLWEQSSQPEKLDEGLAEFLRENGPREGITDDEYHWIMVYVAFYSGMKASIVNDRLPTIERHFRGYQRVADYSENDIRAILQDPAMIRHDGKVRASVENARSIRSIVSKYGSFKAYVDSFGPFSSFNNLTQLKTALQERFSYLGNRTVYHFMTDIGLPVLKPDRVIMRVFHRLGLIPSRGGSEAELLNAIHAGRQFSQATGIPIRQVDFMFVAFGQVDGDTDYLGLNKGICLENRPHCDVCRLTDHCEYYKEQQRNRLAR